MRERMVWRFHPWNSFGLAPFMAVGKQNGMTDQIGHEPLGIVAGQKLGESEFEDQWIGGSLGTHCNQKLRGLFLNFF